MTIKCKNGSINVQNLLCTLQKGNRFYYDLTSEKVTYITCGSGSYYIFKKTAKSFMLQTERQERKTNEAKTRAYKKIIKSLIKTLGGLL